jgi:hypothetical protein
VSLKYRAIRFRVVVSDGRAYILTLPRFEVLTVCLDADVLADGDAG